jgi:hypothetical protein
VEHPGVFDRVRPATRRCGAAVVGHEDALLEQRIDRPHGGGEPGHAAMGTLEALDRLAERDRAVEQRQHRVSLRSDVDDRPQRRVDQHVS